jgi:hypoxanthine phosphoribosyltransferase
MSPDARPSVSLESVEQRIRALPLPDVDAVVAVERGGQAPAEIAASILSRPLGRLRLSFRDDHNTPLYREPRVVAQSEIPCAAGGHILLVDDVSVTGATLRRAAEELASYTISTLVLKGDADLVAFPELETCVTWPW